MQAYEVPLFASTSISVGHRHTQSCNETLVITSALHEFGRPSFLLQIMHLTISSHLQCSNITICLLKIFPSWRYVQGFERRTNTRSLLVICQCLSLQSFGPSKSYLNPMNMASVCINVRTHLSALKARHKPIELLFS